MSNDEFAGWAAFAKNAVNGELRRHSFTPKTWEETDVDIRVQYCGVCASDLSIMSEGWGPTDFPAVCGHEVVGTVVRVGSQVKHLKVGQLAGVGAQAESCLECEYCKAGKEPYCIKGHTPSCGSAYVYGAAKGEKTMGGFADVKRSPAHFAFPIPDGIDPAEAAPMLCGGLTVYSPLAKYGAGTTAKDVGVVGVGGLGHLAVLFASAMGATVTAISHSERKRADASQLGAARFIATHSGRADDFAPFARSLDFILCTTNDVRMPLAGYLSLLRPGGTLIMVGVPEGSLDLPVFPLLMGNIHVGGSAIGSPTEVQQMFALVKAKGIKPWIERRSFDDINACVKDAKDGRARYRYVLVHEANGGKF